VKGVDPDDAFSKVPYEKGSLLLFYLEHEVVGSQEAMLGWLRSYFREFSNKSLDTDQMKAHFLNYFTKVHAADANKLAAVKWDSWLRSPGLPPWDPRPVLDTSLASASIALARKWAGVYFLHPASCHAS
jgi:leukotriene-A4 hydrolase